MLRFVRQESVGMASEEHVFSYAKQNGQGKWYASSSLSECSHVDRFLVLRFSESVISDDSASRQPSLYRPVAFVRNSRLTLAREQEGNFKCTVEVGWKAIE